MVYVNKFGVPSTGRAFVGRSNLVNGIPEIDYLLAVGLLLVTPLGLSMVRWSDPQAERLRVMAAKAAPFAGASAALPLVVDGLSDFGALLSAPWLALSVVVAVSALAELARTRPSSVEPYLPIAACAYLLVGAVWLLFHHSGVRPRSVAAELVELTAVHFTYAGFAAPILAFHASRWLRALPGRWDRLAAFAGVGVVLAMILVAAGISGSPLMEVEGSILMALSLVAIAAGTTLIAFRLPVPARILLLVSSAAVWVAMALAVQYAFGQYTVSGSVSVRDMAQTHGVLNLVFAVAGLLGWKQAASKNVLREQQAGQAPAAEPAAPVTGQAEASAAAEEDS